MAVEGGIGVHPEASLALQSSFLVLPVLLLAAIGYGWTRAYRQVGQGRAARVVWPLCALWMAGPGALAASGVLRDVSGPVPVLMRMFALLAIATLAITTARAGARLAESLPLWLLVGFQGFRLPLELMMHMAASEGVMPPQMSMAGDNLDIVTGATALVVAAGLRSGWLGARAALAWNLLGVALLINVLIVAIRSMPHIAAYGPEHVNTWVTYPPFVWLPAVMVCAALGGHVLVFRKLRSLRASAS